MTFTRMRRSMAVLLTAGSAWALGGCGDSPPSVDSTKTEATVKGVVKIGGAPATEGEISFNPANSKRPDEPARTAPIGKDGTYTVKTLTGENEVRLGGSIAKKNSMLQREKRSLNVKSGENTFDFDASAK